MQQTKTFNFVIVTLHLVLHSIKCCYYCCFVWCYGIVTTFSCHHSQCNIIRFYDVADCHVCGYSPGRDITEAEKFKQSEQKMVIL